mmetsp:Transcript_10786/g.21103  ORF Transcript_10786/g.21103 Transcript_10786/m.21103 type:complete len:409 (+) Transcript_10786:608-1834(+)
MRAERAKYDEKLNELTEANMKLSQDLDNANARIRFCGKVENELKNSLSEMESNYSDLMSELKTVKFQLKNKDRSIERLESEITKEADEENLASQALKASKKENIQLKNELRTLRANYEATEGSVEELRTQLSVVTKEIRSVKKEVAKKQEEIQCLMEELDISRETTKELKEKMGKYKEECSRQYNDRIKTLQNEKKELEDRLKEIHDETSDTKSLFEHPSLHEELANLEDFKPERVSCLFNSFGDNKKVENLKAELAEKESMIESLTKSKDELQTNLNKANKQLFKAMRQLTDLEQSKEAEVTRFRGLVREMQSQKSGEDSTELHMKIMELQSEVDRLNKEVELTHLATADEIKKLTLALRDAEFKGAETRMQYYEAIKELKVLKQHTLEETQTKGALHRISSIFKRA